MNFFKDHLNLSNNIYDNAKILKSVELNKQQELVNRNPTTKYYQTLAQNIQEQVQYLKRQLNEAASPPTIAPLDQSYPTENGGGATDVYGNPLSGPNYNFPPSPGLGQGSGGGMRDFFPSGLSRTVGPDPSDYPGGDRNPQYLIDIQRYRLACAAYDRVYGTGRKPTDGLGGMIRKARDVIDDVSSPNFGRSR